MRPTLERCKSAKYPKKPTNIDEICKSFSDSKIREKYGLTLDGDADFYIDTVQHHDHAFTIYASKFVIEFIKKNIPPESRHYLMDGTFDSIPLPAEFYQLLIITIEYQNDVSSAVRVVLILCPSVIYL